MKKSLLAFSFCLLHLAVFSQGSWNQMQSFIAARFVTSTFEINGKAYMVGGLINGTALNDCWEYFNNIWTQKANFPGGLRGGMFSFGANGKGYCGIGGDGNGTTYKTFYMFDPIANTWAPKANFPGIARYTIGAMIYNGNGYFSNGIDSTATIPMNEVYEYNSTTDTWTQKNSIPSSTRFTTSNFTIGQYAYACSGFTGTAQVQDLWEYDMVNDVWTQKANFPGQGRTGGCGFAIGNYGYYGLGVDILSGPVLNDFYQYNQTSNLWTTMTSLNDSFNVYRASFVLNGKGYVVGGDKGSPQFLTNKTWEFTPTIVGEDDVAASLNTTIGIYPNPLTETSTVTVDDENNSSEKILQVFDLGGKLIKEIGMQNNSIVINKENFSSGIYLLKIRSEGKTIASSKLIVQ